MKPDPVTVNIKLSLPACTQEGSSMLTLGVGFLTSKLIPFEISPDGLSTVIVAIPVVDMSDARIVAVNWLPETNVVGRLDPFH